MKKKIICKVCKKEKLHEAFCMCKSCYMKKYYRKYPIPKQIINNRNNPKRRGKANDRYWDKNRDKINSLRRLKYQQNINNTKLKTFARQVVRDALKKGILIKPPCCQNCGRVGKVEGHHKDYFKPLDVDWLCIRCHKINHRLYE